MLPSIWEASPVAQALDQPVNLDLSALRAAVRDAFARHAWAEAYELLAAADARGGLAPDDLEVLGQASWWTGKLAAAIEARERAYAGFAAARDDGRAAMTAIALGRDNLLRNAHSIATAWLNRAERFLNTTDEGAAHAALAHTRAVQAGLAGHFDEALAQSERALTIARRLGDRTLEALGMSAKGLSLVYLGRVDEGLALVDEATVAAIGGEVDPFAAGAVSCTTISACASVGDWVRAGQWTEAQDRWCQREGISGYPGMCRLHRAETKRLRGAWVEAEAEARRASEELAGFIPAAIGVAWYEIGAIRLRRGDLPAAEDALLRAHAYGRDPEPALSLVRLAQGRVEEARVSIRRALDEPEQANGWGAPPGSDLNRLSLLPAQVEIALAVGDVATARSAADELATLVQRFPTTASRARGACVEGLVRLAEGRAAEAVRLARESMQLWGELEAPWQVARARVLLARAYAAIGDRDGARLELQAARAAFDELGADLDRRQAETELAALGTDGGTPTLAPGRRIVTRTFVFTDIVDSTRFAELLGDEAWERLVRWHDELIRSLVAEHAGEVIKSTGDGFFLAFERSGPAIDCAIAVQRRLAEQRRTQGFAPALRVGLHHGPARRTGSDYIGTNVNEAARISAIAQGGEILASIPTLEEAGRLAMAGERRTVRLKGIAGPVEVATIAW